MNLVSEECFNYCIDNQIPYFGHGLKAQQGAIIRHAYMDKLISQECFNKTDPYYILEIGSYAGMSTVTWAKAIQKYNKGNGKVFCIDPWQPYLNPVKDASVYETSKVMNRGLKDGQVYRLFQHNIITSGCEENILVIKDKSDNILPSLSRKFDLIYIDGNHIYNQFKKDLVNSISLVKHNGILCGDDLEATLDEVSLANEMIQELPNLECIQEVLTDDKTIRYHPGVTKAVGELFNPVSRWEGFWAMRKNENNWEEVVLNDIDNVEVPEHLKSWERTYKT